MTDDPDNDAVTDVQPAPAAEPATTQEPPTEPQRRDHFGHLLDQWDLPVAGPLRIARLAELGRPDPLNSPEDWN